MRKIHAFIAVALIGVLVSFGVSAGQDQVLIDQIRKKQAEKMKANPESQSESSKAVMPLDHGPHAQVTPWVNEQRRKAENTNVEKP